MLKVEQRIRSYDNEKLVRMGFRVNRESQRVADQIMGDFSSMEPASVERVYGRMRVLGLLAGRIAQELERRQDQGGVK